MSLYKVPYPAKSYTNEQITQEKKIINDNKSLPTKLKNRNNSKPSIQMTENKGTSPVDLYEEILYKTAALHSNLFAFQLAHCHKEGSKHSQPWLHHACGLLTNEIKLRISNQFEIHILGTWSQGSPIISGHFKVGFQII